MTPLETLRDSPLLSADAKALLDWVEPPDNLQAFELVISGVERLLPIMEELAGADETLEALSSSVVLSVRAGVQNLRQQENAFLTIDDERTHWGRDRKSPFHGTIENHPLYVALGSVGASDPPVVKALLVLTSVVAGVAKQLDQIKRPGSDFTSARRSALDSARLFSKLTLLNALPDRFEDVEGYLTALEGLVENAATQKKELNHPVAIARALRFLITKTGGRRRGGQILTDERWQIESSAGSGVRVQRVAPVSPDERRQIRQSGLSFDEFAGDVEYVDLLSIDPDDEDEDEDEDEADDEDVLTDRPKPPEPEPPPPSLSAQVMRRINIVGQIERAAQMMPCSWERLVPFELAAVQGQLETALAKYSNQPPTRFTADHQIDVESHILIGVMLWLGRSFQQAIQLKLYATPDDLPRAMPNQSIAIVRSNGYAHWPVIRPKASPTYKNADMALARPVSDRVAFSVPPELLLALEFLPAWHRLRSSENPQGPTSVDAFMLPANHLQVAVDASRRTIVAEGGNRITISRISQAMFTYVLDETGDLAVASLAIARPHRLSDTALHYTNIASDRLSDVMVRASDRMADLITNELNRPRPHRQPSSANPPALPPYSGSPICPTELTVTDAVVALQKAFKTEQRAVMVDDYWITLHNAFAMYVHFVLRLAIGLRDVGEPLPSWDHINIDRQVIFISDKDDVAGYSSRVLPLPALVCDLVVAWKKHVASMKAHLLNERFKHGERARRINNGILHYWVRTQSGQVPPVSSTHPWIREKLGEYLPAFGLPLNCNRHYLRSRLSEVNVPPEMIDAFMGHWRRGQEPWGRYSMLPLNLILETLRPAIDRLLIDLGVRVVKGGSNGKPRQDAICFR